MSCPNEKGLDLLIEPVLFVKFAADPGQDSVDDPGDDAEEPELDGFSAGK
jgi:hypothetical protein